VNVPLLELTFRSIVEPKRKRERVLTMCGILFAKIIFIIIIPNLVVCGLFISLR